MGRVVKGANGRGRVLIHDGYKYQMNAKTVTTMTWRCWRKSCRVTLKTRLFNRDADDPQIEVLMNDHGETNRDHNHEPEDELIEHVEFVNEAKAAILVDPTKPIKRIYDEHLASTHQNVQGGGDRPPRVPDFRSVRSQMARKRSQIMPDIPHETEQVIFEESWKETWRGHRFILHQDNHWGIVIFATHANMTASFSASSLYMDATF